jgi:hypothetical protein
MPENKTGFGFYLTLLLVFIGASLFIRSDTQLYIFIPSFIILAILNPKGLKIFLKWKFLVFIVILICIIPLISLKKESLFMGIAYSGDFLRTNLMMLQRGIIIILAVRMFTSKISLDVLSAKLRRIKFMNFGEILSIAITVLPQISELAVKPLKGISFRKLKFSFLSEYAVSVIVNVIRYADKYITGSF